MSSSNDFPNCHLVQYAIDVNGNMDPKWSRQFQQIENTLVPGLYFYGVKASKYGIRKIKDATHFAIIDLNARNADEMFLYNSELPAPGRQVIALDNHYLVVRATNHNMKIAISKHKTLRQAKNNLKEQSS